MNIIMAVGSSVVISQGSRKFSFTACHLGKPQLASTRVKVIFASLNYISMSRIDYSSSNVNSPKHFNFMSGK